MTSLVVLLVTFTTAFVTAQNQQPTRIPRRAQGAGSSRLGTHQFELIRKGLDLSKEQNGPFNELIETYKARVMEEAMALLGNVEEMQGVSHELKAARAAGDTKQAAALEARLRDLRPETRPTNEFYRDLPKILNERQKRQLVKLRSMLEGKGGLVDMRLKPRQAVRLAESLGLTPKQADTIRRRQDAFREKMRAVPRNDEATKQTLMKQFMADIRAALTDQQAARFDAQLSER